MFPALPLAIAFPLAALTYVVLFVVAHKRYGVAMAVYYAGWLLLFGAVTALLGWADPSRWSAWAEAVQRSTIGTVVAAAAMIWWLRGRLTPWGWRAMAPGVVFTLALLHAVLGWGVGAGWESAAAGVLGSAVASTAVFFGLCRWPWWVERWEDMIAMEIGRWSGRDGLEVVR